jgi:hypothetical protein
MDEWLAEPFDADRTRSRAVTCRTLESSDADDAMQKTRLHLRRSRTSGIDLSGWPATAVARTYETRPGDVSSTDHCDHEKLR